MPAVPACHEPQHAMTAGEGGKPNRKFALKHQADSAVIKNEDR